jgi:hypothetical protein
MGRKWLYDPGSDAWTVVAPMTTPRWGHELLATPNGTVFAAGGSTGEYNPRMTAEIYDIHADQWSPVASMQTPHLLHAMAPLNDGRFLVAGGYDAAFPFDTTAVVELFDPATEMWSAAVGTLPYPVANLKSVVFHDGRVLFTGGRQQLASDGKIVQRAMAAVFDPHTNEIVAVAEMRQARSDHTATLLVDGSALAAGGITPGFVRTTTAEIYRP